MSKDYYFISTNLELDLDNKKEKILAGNWCITNHKDKKLKKKYQTFILIKKIEFLLLIFQKLTKKKFLKLLSLLKVKD